MKWPKNVFDGNATAAVAEYCEIFCCTMKNRNETVNKNDNDEQTYLLLFFVLFVSKISISFAANSHRAAFFFGLSRSRYSRFSSIDRRCWFRFSKDGMTVVI